MSNIQNIPVSDATATQLAWHAEVIEGLPKMSPTKGVAHILGEIRKVNPGIAEVSIKVAPPSAPKVIGKPDASVEEDDNLTDEQRSMRRANEMVTILIPSQEKAGGDEPVPAAVNGTQIWIPRNEEVKVKRKYYEALMNAKKRVYDTDKNKRIINPNGRDVPEYPVQLLHDPNPAIAA